MTRRKKHARRSQDKTQDTVCKMIKVAKADEKKGNTSYLRMASKLPALKWKRVPSSIAHQERHHLSELKKMERELMC